MKHFVLYTLQQTGTLGMCVCVSRVPSLALTGSVIRHYVIYMIIYHFSELLSYQVFSSRITSTHVAQRFEMGF